MKVKIGQVILILGLILFVVGAIGFVVGFLPQSAIIARGALALIFVGVGASMRRRV